MVDQTNIFEGQSDPSTNGEQKEAPAFQLPEGVNEFIGEGKKYSDINKALESIPHANKHISTLEAELAEARQKLAAAKSVEDALKELTQVKQETGTPTSQPVDLNEISKLVDQRLIEQEQTKVRNQNIQTVVSTLIDQFGDKEKAEKVFEAKAKELGVDVRYLNDLAAKSPKAVFTLFGSSQNNSSPSFAKSSVNTTGFQSTPQSKGPTKSVMSGASTSEVLNAWRAVTASIKGD